MINKLLKELEELTNIEILEKSEKMAKVKLLDFKKNKVTEYDYIVLNFYDYYLIKALKLNQEFNNKIKTLDGLMSLRDDIREVANHIIELGEDYIDFNLKQNNYDKDPFCNNRLSIYELEELERAMEERPEIRSYKPYYLFTYNKKRVDITNVDKIIDEMIREGIVRTRSKQ